MKLLTRLQQMLETLYELERVADVRPFVFSDAALAACLNELANTVLRDEMLFVNQEGDELSVSLYLEEKLVTRLRQHDPEECLGPHNLASFLKLLEGISHFVYLIWNASHKRPVSLFELELQAEVDKFVICYLLLARQQDHQRFRKLFRKLFLQSGFESRLDVVELDRYRKANDYAANYCQRLNHLFNRRHLNLSCINELRRFYRLNHRTKTRYIGAA